MASLSHALPCCVAEADTLPSLNLSVLRREEATGAWDREGAGKSQLKVQLGEVSPPSGSTEEVTCKDPEASSL